MPSSKLPLVIIGTLEGIQQIPDRRQGSVGVRSVDLGTTVQAQYIPAAIALAISLMFDSIEQVVAAVAPYATLKKGNAPAYWTLKVDYLSKSGPHVFVLSLLNGHLALPIILAITFVSSFLSIVIPGLYSHITLPMTVETTLLQVDKFYSGGLDLSRDDDQSCTGVEFVDIPQHEISIMDIR